MVLLFYTTYISVDIAHHEIFRAKAGKGGITAARNWFNDCSSLSGQVMYRLFNVLCWLWNINEGAELPSVYFITNTKHCITYLALTQLYPVLLTSRFHIVKFTHYVVFYCISYMSLSFLF